MTAKKDDMATSLRLIIQEAVRGYELAMATRLKIERDTNTGHDQYMTSVAALEQRANQERERDQQREQSAAMIEQARIQTLAQLAGEAQEAAKDLLEAAALAHVRGVGNLSAGRIEQHTTTDQQAAAAFTAAQTAAIDLHAALLRLARAHLENRSWESARSILTPIQSATTGALRDEATAILYSTYLEQAVAANANADGAQARDLIDLALKLFADDRGTDPVLADQLLWATGQLVEAAMAEGRLADAAHHAVNAARKIGRNHSELHQWTRRNTLLSWACGFATCTQEFGGHRQPVQHVAVTPDGGYVISVDGSDIKKWRTPRAGSGELVHTIPATDAYKLTGDTQLAVTADGQLLSTRDGKPLSRLELGSPGSVAAFASTKDGSVAAWAIRDESPSRRVNLWGENGYTPVGKDGQAAEPADAEWLGPLQRTQGTTRWGFKDAVETGQPRSGTRYLSTGDSYRPTRADNYTFRNAAIRLIKTVHVGEGRTGKATCNIPVTPFAIILDMALASSGQFIALLHPAGQLALIDIATGLARHTFELARSQTTYDAVAISPCDQLVAVAQAQWASDQRRNQGWCSTITAWNVPSGAKLFSWDISGLVGAIAFSPDDRLIASLDTNGNIALYDTRAQSPLPPIGNHGKTAFPCLAFSPDGSHLVTSGDCTVKIWGMP